MSGQASDTVDSMNIIKTVAMNNTVAATRLASEINFNAFTARIHEAKEANIGIVRSGHIAIIPPKVVATPFPPPNLSQGEYM